MFGEIDRSFAYSSLIDSFARVGGTTMSSETRNGSGDDAGAVPLGELADENAGPSVIAVVQPEDVSLPDIEDGPAVETGRLDGRMVAQIISSNRRSIESCYDRSLRAGSKIGGKVEVGIKVEPSGSVSTANVLSKDFQKTDFAKCLTAAIRRWRFPPINKAKQMTVPFVLNGPN
jgi:TonB family protein